MKKLLSFFVAILLAALTSVPAHGISGNGCEQDSNYQTSYSPGCFLEHPDESTELSGVVFDYVITSCASPWGSGRDSLAYIYFEDVDPANGKLLAGKTYEIELFFAHDCRDYEGAYEMDVILNSPVGDLAEATLVDERYSSYKSSRVSNRSNYCLFYSCGRTFFHYELTIPTQAPADIYSLRIDARTIPENNQYGFSAVKDTFNFSDAFELIANGEEDTEQEPEPGNFDEGTGDSEQQQEPEPESNDSEAESQDPDVAHLAGQGPADGEFSAWTKSMANGEQIKFYAKYLQPGQKVQFMVQNSAGNYVQYAWKRVEAEDLNSDGSYAEMQNHIYFIRTLDLKPGKNRVRILVDGEIVWGTKTYVP